jgi:hypothetical protein
MQRFFPWCVTSLLVAAAAFAQPVTLNENVHS